MNLKKSFFNKKSIWYLF